VHKLSHCIAVLRELSVWSWAGMGVWVVPSCSFCLWS